MTRTKTDWNAVQENLRITDIPYRYYFKSDPVPIYTTARLYDGGNYLAALVERDGTVIFRREFAKRGDAAEQARDWAHGVGQQYTIGEEP